MNLETLHRRLLRREHALLVASAALLILASSLLTSHAQAIGEMRDVAVPAAVRIPQLQSHLAILKGQLEASDLQQEIRGGSPDEMVQAYVLPDSTDLQSVLGLFDVIRDEWTAQKTLFHLAPIKAGETTVRMYKDASGQNIDVDVTPLHIEAEMTSQGADDLVSLVRFAGLLTVGDVLTKDETARIIALSEKEDPAGITLIEHFFATDLLSYSREPGVHEDAVLRAYSSPQFTLSFRQILSDSALASARSLLSGQTGRTIAKQKLWPLRAMHIDHLTLESASDDSVRIILDIAVYSRPQG